MIYIRVDMNPVIATGHLMRCLSIAEAAAEDGEEITIISADDYPTEMVKARGYNHIVLGTDWTKMNEEISIMKKIIVDYDIKVILVDSYQVTEEYLRELNTVTKVFYIDDLNQCKHFVTGLINYACYAEDMTYTVEGVKYFKGCEFAPLRKMFRKCDKRKANDKPQKLMIMSGGTDPCDMLGRTITVIRDNIPCKYAEITLICGRYYTNIDRLKTIVSAGGNEFEARINILSSVDNMLDYLEEADIVISAGGTTMYEVCAVGVPTISFAIADNQLRNVEWLDRHDIVPCAGDARIEGTEKNVLELLKRFDDVETVNEYSKRMQELVDGYGAVRVARLLIDYTNQ